MSRPLCACADVDTALARPANSVRDNRIAKLLTYWINKISHDARSRAMQKIILRRQTRVFDTSPALAPAKLRDAPAHHNPKPNSCRWAMLLPASPFRAHHESVRYTAR
jgi:hypothetical protein